MRSLPKAAILIVALLHVLSSCYGQRKKEDGGIETIVLGANSQKPAEIFVADKSHEEIILQRLGSSYTISAAVNMPRPKIKQYTIQSLAITQQEWEAVVQLIQNSNLLGWKQKTFYNNGVVDGSNKQVEITFSNKAVSRFIWVNHPLGEAQSFANYMIALVNKRIPNHHLLFLAKPEGVSL